MLWKTWSWVGALISLGGSLTVTLHEEWKHVPSISTCTGPRMVTHQCTHSASSNHQALDDVVPMCLQEAGFSGTLAAVG